MVQTEQQTRHRLRTVFRWLGLLNLIIAPLGVITTYPVALAGAQAAVGLSLLLASTWQTASIGDRRIRWWHVGSVSMLGLAMVALFGLRAVDSWPSRTYFYISAGTMAIVFIPASIDLFVGGTYFFPRVDSDIE